MLRSPSNALPFVTLAALNLVYFGLSLDERIATATPERTAEANQACLDCHGEEGFERDEPKAPGDLYVDPDLYRASIHGGMSCKTCHNDAQLVDDEHEPDLAEVNCARCHAKSRTLYDQSIHGRSLARGDPLAPHCEDCHSAHAVFPPDDPRSSTYKFNVPTTCSRCHQEGTDVTLTRKLSQHQVLKQYSMSIHGVGLYEQGLLVTAVCTDCHGTHLILPHNDSRSSIFVSTFRRCVCNATPRSSAYTKKSSKESYGRKGPTKCQSASTAIPPISSRMCAIKSRSATKPASRVIATKVLSPHILQTASA